VLGLPFDAVDLNGAANRVRHADSGDKRLLLSTVNVNFVVSALRDDSFRQSILHSQLSLADGMPIVWISRLLGLPIGERVPGSDLFENLRRTCGGEPLKVYFFGGDPGIAELAAKSVNASPAGVRCVGFDDAGRGSVDSLSTQDHIRKINEAAPHFLIVSLGAQKGQSWIERNRHALKVPVVSHLGAVLAFAAGNVERAPRWVQRMGMEWAWRIKEQPMLWRRYAGDGQQLIRLFVQCVLPLWAMRLRNGLRPADHFAPPTLERIGEELRLRLYGRCDAQASEAMVDCLKNAAAERCDIVVDLRDVESIDAVAMGRLLLLYGYQRDIGCKLRFVGVSKSMRRLFRRHCTQYLLTEAPVMPSFAASVAPASFV
jgi:N-acetylglucosaminyldiphosphoundecaprenol N-acetyl-beta-D-mannosaminyltransferase